MLEKAVSRFLLTKAALDADTKEFYRKALNAYSRTSPDWPVTLEAIVKFVTHSQAHRADSTTYAYYTVVRMFAAWLYRRHFIEENPLEDLSPPKGPEDLPRAIPAEVLGTLFDHLEARVEYVLTPGRKTHPFYGWQEIRDLAFFSLLLDTGLRLNEACNILVEDVDLKRQCVFVRHGKRKRQRFVVIGKRTRADLRLWLTVRERISLAEDEPAYFFLKKYRGWGRVSPAGMEQILWQRLETLSTQPKFTPHQLRHTYADMALKAGADLREVQAQLGHINLRTTLKYLKGVSSQRIEHHDQTSPRDMLFRGR